MVLNFHRKTKTNLSKWGNNMIIPQLVQWGRFPCSKEMSCCRKKQVVKLDRSVTVCGYFLTCTDPNKNLWGFR